LDSAIYATNEADLDAAILKAIESFLKDGIDPQGTVRLSAQSEDHYLDVSYTIVISIPDFLKEVPNIDGDAVEHFLEADSWDLTKFQYPRWGGIGDGMDYKEAKEYMAEEAEYRILEEFPELEKEKEAAGIIEK
jgi:hypothetical protein